MPSEREAAMNLSFKLFLEEENRYILGPGRVELLRAVEELGSLRKAAQKLGMSYRWAWGRLRDVEKALGVPLLESGESAARGAAKTLTPQARELLAWYSGLEKDIAAALDKGAAAWPVFLRPGSTQGRD